jgi:hypothetical protein
MATHIIKIGTTHRDHKHPERSRISLSDHGKTSVKRSDTVIWVNQNPQIDSFLILFNDSRRIRLFHAAPAPLASFEGKKWKVRIDPDALPGTAYEYTICWVQDGQVYAYDPKIQVN